MEATICAPAPPDPQETASAQTGTNVGTAIANAMMGNVNQITPDGSLSYDQTGTHSWTDPYTGQTYEIPRFTATQTLSPEQQAIQTSANEARGNLAGLASTLTANAQEGLANPFEFNNQDAANWAYDLGAERLDPRFARQEESLRTRLLNSGIREGSAAWDAEMGRHSQAQNDAYNGLMLNGRQMAYNEARDQYTLPINTATALLSGSQVNSPNFVNTQQPTIPTTDTAGIIGNNYQQQMQQYASNQALIGGIMGGAGQLISLSDDDAKKAKKKVGETEGGLGVYSYRYKGEPDSGPKRMGLMASEVERKNPGAVQRRGGLRHVNYTEALGAA